MIQYSRFSFLIFMNQNFFREIQTSYPLFVVVWWRPSEQVPGYLPTKVFHSALHELRERNAHLRRPCLHLDSDLPALLLLHPFPIAPRPHSGRHRGMHSRGR